MNRSEWIYLSSQSAIRAVLSSNEVQQYIRSSLTFEEPSLDNDGGRNSNFYWTFEPRPINQNDLDDLIRDLGMSTKGITTSSPQLNEMNFRILDTNI